MPNATPKTAVPKPLVWTIIVNWNGKEDTLACLQSLRGVTYETRHVLVIDNGSNDGSEAAIRQAFPEVQFLHNNDNLGFARASNQGITSALSAGADFVLLLNNDTEVAPDFLDHLMLTALFQDRVGMVAPKIYYHHQPQTIWFAGGRVNLWTGHIYHLQLRQLDRPSCEVAKPVDYLTGCALLVSAACIQEIGLLDDAYSMYAEDVDWCMRARLAGFECFYQPESKVWHKVSASAGSSFKIYHKVRSNYRFFQKYARWYHWLTIPFGVTAGAILEITRRFFAHPAQALEMVCSMLRSMRDIVLARTPQTKLPAKQ